MRSLIKEIFISIMLMVSMSTLAQISSPSVITYKIGDYKISLLAESQQQGKTGILLGATEEMLEKYAPDGSFPNAMNAFLVQTPDKNILFDSGIGKKLFENLNSLGVSADDIDILCITHMHGDHIGGMLKEDKATFPNAEVYLSQPEHDYWMNQNNPQPKKVIELYRNRLHLFEPGKLGEQIQDLLPGITGIAAYGHTPGHTGFMVESKGEKIFIWGDLAHAMAVQMPFPHVAVTYDVDPEEAVDIRKKILEYVTLHKIPIAGMHIAYPAMGKIKESTSGGYTFVPLK